MDVGFFPFRDARRSLYPFPTYDARFPPAVPKHYLGDSFWRGGVVLDPFMGTGTVGGVCAELGLGFCGVDNSALAHWISLKWCLPLVGEDLERCHGLYSYILGRLYSAHVLSGAGEMYRGVLEGCSGFGECDVDRAGEVWDRHVAEYGFSVDERYGGVAGQVALDVATVLTVLALEDPGEVVEHFIKLVLVQALHDARLTYHSRFDTVRRERPERIYWCLNHGRWCCFGLSLYPYFKKFGERLFRGYREYIRDVGEGAWERLEFHRGDSRRLDWFPGGMRFRGVVTSPPYLGLMDYHGRNAYAFEVLGLDGNEGAEIGRERACSKGQYVDDMVEVFVGLRGLLEEGARVHCVVADEAGLYRDIFRWSRYKVDSVDVHDVQGRAMAHSDYREFVYNCHVA